MTKAIVGSIVLIAMLAAGVWGYMVWSNGKLSRVEQALRNAAAAHTDAENRVVIFRYQNRSLKEYVVSLEQALRGVGRELPPTPTERLSDEEVFGNPPLPNRKSLQTLGAVGAARPASQSFRGRVEASWYPVATFRLRDRSAAPAPQSADRRRILARTAGRAGRRPSKREVRR
jgi:hypothetical protein